MKTVVVTGVSSGIGEATTKKLLESGFRVIGIHRGDEPLSFATSEQQEAFIPICCDMRDGDRIKEIESVIHEIVGTENLFGLVNNAGISLLGPVVYQDPKEFQEQLETNLMGPLRMIQALFPLLGGEGGGRGKPGRIVNVTSVSGRLVFPFMGSYSASKFALEALSDALRRELSEYGIKTIVVEPGAIRTPLWQKTTENWENPYKGTDLGERFARFVQMFAERGARDGLPASRAASVIFKALVTDQPRPRYTIMKYPVRDFLFPRLLPDSRVDSMIRAQLR